MKNKNFTFYIVLIIVTITIALGIFIVWELETSPRTNDAYVYADTISVAPEVSGKIVEIPVRENMSVKKGDVLIVIDQKQYSISLNQAKANMIALEKQIERAQKTIDSQTFAAEAAKKNEEQAKLTHKQAQLDYNRVEPLNKMGYASNQQMDKTTTALKIAKEQEAAASLSAKSANKAIMLIDDLIAQKDVIQTQIDMAELNLSRTVVYAPFDGKIVSLRTTVGQYVSPGSQIFTLVDTNNWYVLANFRETDLEMMKKDDKATIYLLSNTGETFDAKLDSIGYGVLPDDGGNIVNGLPSVARSINWVRVAQRFPVKFKVENPKENMFRIGASASVIVKK